MFKLQFETIESKNFKKYSNQLRLRLIFLQEFLDKL